MFLAAAWCIWMRLVAQVTQRDRAWTRHPVTTTGAVRVGYDPLRRCFLLDRRTSAPEFTGQSEWHDAARSSDAPENRVEILGEGSMLEVSAYGGTVVISDPVYADPAAMGATVFHGPENPLLHSLSLHRVSTCVKGHAAGPRRQTSEEQHVRGLR